MVRRMAGDAADVVPQVHRIDGAHVLRAAGMAVEAAGTDLLCRCTFEGKYFGLVSSAVDVSLPRTVTSFAAMPLGALLHIQSGGKVRGILEALEESFDGEIFVTGLARLGANVERGIGRARIVFLIRVVS